MATCNQSIATLLDGPGYDSLEEIAPGVSYPFSVDANNNALYALRTPVFQTITISAMITSQPPFGTAFSLFRIEDDGAITPYGGSTVSSFSGTFVVDIPAGDFIVCIRPSGFNPQSGSFAASFVSYPSTAHLPPRVYVGEAMSVKFADPPLPPRECNEALFFEVVEGELPPGLSMDWMGTVTGILPNMDTVPDRLSPGVGWFYTENDDNIYPWGRQYRFKVRVWIDGFRDEYFAEEWFCVAIHNNWSFDRDHFLKCAPFEKTVLEEVIEQPKPLGPICYPCNDPDPERFIPKPIPDVPCAPCETVKTPVRVELIELPEALCSKETDEIISWYQVNENNASCDELQAFIKSLDESVAFQQLRARAGLREPIDDTIVSVMRYRQFLQLAQIEIESQEHDPNITDQVRQWRDYENQILPTTGLGYTGEGARMTLR